MPIPFVQKKFVQTKKLTRTAPLSEDFVQTKNSAVILALLGDFVQTKSRSAHQTTGKFVQTKKETTTMKTFDHDDLLLDLMIMPKFPRHSDPDSGPNSNHNPAAPFALSPIKTPNSGRTRRTTARRFRRSNSRQDFAQSLKQATTANRATMTIAATIAAAKLTATQITANQIASAAPTATAPDASPLPAAAPATAKKAPIATIPSGPQKPFLERPLSPCAEPLSDCFITVKAPAIGRQHLSPGNSCGTADTQQAVPLSGQGAMADSNPALS